MSVWNDFPAWARRQIGADVRARGDRYHEHGWVKLTQQDETRLEAVVTGSEPYRVMVLAPQPGPAGPQRFVWSCSCPAFAGQSGCKHLWAVAVATIGGVKVGRPPATAKPRSVARVEARAFTLLRALAPMLEALDAPDAPHAEPEPRPPSRPAPASTWDSGLRELERHAQLEARAHQAQAPTKSAELALGIAVQPPGDAGQLALGTYTRLREKHGGWGRLQPHDPQRPKRNPTLDDEERRWLAMLCGARPRTSSYFLSSHEFDPSPELLLDVLPAAAARGKLLLVEFNERTASELAWDPGEPWKLGISIVGGPGESVVAIGFLERAGDRVLLDQIQALDPAGFAVLRGSAARFDARGGWVVAEFLHSARVIRAPAGERLELTRRLAALAGEALVPEAALEWRTDVVPRPQVDIAPESRFAGGGALLLKLWFDYGGARIRAGDPSVIVFPPGDSRASRRDFKAEEAARGVLRELGVALMGRGRGDGGPDAVLDAGAFPRVARELLARDWTVVAEGQSWRLPGQSSLRVESGIDWFELQGDVQYGDSKVEIPELLRALESGQGYVRLGDGSRGLLPEEWLGRWSSVLGIGELGRRGVRVKSNHGWLLAAALDGRAEVAADATFESLRTGLADWTRPVAAQEPQGFRGELRAYQREGLAWLGHSRAIGLGACLADDMGLGKTAQLLAHVAKLRQEKAIERRAVLVVAPKSLTFHWLGEARRFVPDVGVVDYTGGDRTARRESVGKADLVVTTYGILRQDADWLTEQEFDTVVLDESQAIKNPLSVSAKAAKALKARHRIALTGTPIENHLGELASLLEFLNPGFVPRGGPIRELLEGKKRARGTDDLELLARSVRPFFLRRTKEQVLPELPQRLEQELVCELDGRQKAYYAELKAHYRSKLLARVERDGMAKSKIHVLEALLRLRQAACHPALVDPARDVENSAKLEMLVPMLVEVAAGGHKALVFSQFTSFLALLQARLKREHLKWEYLDGKTKDREAAVSRFQSADGPPLFLISLRAGGFGLNLTAADYVFILDPWWNPAVERQAVDRTHRIGQTRRVMAYRLIAKGTVEEKVLELQSKKRALAQAIIDEAPAMLAQLSREDLDALLS